MSREILEAVRAIEREKGIDSDELLSALEDALLAAYRKTPDAVPFARVEIDGNDGVFRLFQFVGDELPDDALILTEEIDDELLPESEMPSDDEDEDEISFDIDWSKVPTEFVTVEEVHPEGSFGRIAAQTARQVILQRIRDAERGMMYDEFADRVGDLVTGIVQQSDRRVTLVDLGSAEAILPRSESIPGERYDHGTRLKAVILEVRDNSRGPQIVLSRGSTELIHRLFEMEVPEVGDGLVTIRSIAREPGFRSKISVESDQQGVDPVGACVGPRGSRVRMVVSELRGEKIDIIPYNDEPARFIAKALSPARVREVIVDDEQRQATVLVPEDQLALAIGREGQNARLASKLTGWGIDIRSSEEYAAGEEGTKIDDEGEETEGGADARERLEAQRKRTSGPVEVNMYRTLPKRDAEGEPVAGDAADDAAAADDAGAEPTDAPADDAEATAADDTVDAEATEPTAADETVDAEAPAADSDAVEPAEDADADVEAVADQPADDVADATADQTADLDADAPDAAADSEADAEPVVAEQVAAAAEADGGDGDA